MSPPRGPAWATDLVSAARQHPDDVATALEFSRTYGAWLPLPGAGRTAERWAVLSALGRADLSAARVFEAHTDALAILAEHAGSGPADDASVHCTWGVFAAEGPGVRLEGEVGSDGSAALSGVKPWCSLGGQLDAALVTAHVGDERQLFRVDLRQHGVHVADPQGWVARGLRGVTSGPVEFDRVSATSVGEAGWYLRRPGFAWGGIGVAACWHGGARGVADTLRRKAAARPDPVLALHVGAVDAALHASAAVLESAAGVVDSAAGAASPELLAARVRAVVADAVERVLHHAGHALGPAALAFDADHARRVADLTLYVRQHHGERDLVALGDLAMGDLAMGDLAMGESVLDERTRGG